MNGRDAKDTPRHVLLIVVEEHDRPMRFAAVTLARRIVAAPERVEQFGVADPPRVEYHAHGFDVAGVSGADLPIRRIRDVAAGETGDGRDDAVNPAKRFFDTEEAPGGEGLPGTPQKKFHLKAEPEGTHPTQSLS